MSSVINPVGPEDSGVYWRRRALVVGIALVVLFLIWFIFLRSDGEEEPQGEAVAASASPETAGDPSPTPEEAESPAADGVCTDEDIVVEVETDATSYGAGENPQITMRIQNTGGAACERNIGSDANTIEISSGGVPVWSSDDCQEPGTSDEQMLEPDKVASLTITWDRTSSTQGCDNPPEAQAGAYAVVGINADVESEEATFILQ